GYRTTQVHCQHYRVRTPSTHDRGAHLRGAELGRGKTFQLAMEGAHRRTGRRDDDDRIRMHALLLSLAAGSLERFRLPAGRSARRRARRATAVLPGLPTWR